MLFHCLPRLLDTDLDLLNPLVPRIGLLPVSLHISFLLGPDNNLLEPLGPGSRSFINQNPNLYLKVSDASRYGFPEFGSGWQGKSTIFS